MMCKIGKTIYHIIGAFTGMSVRHPLEKKWKSILKNKPNQKTIAGWLQRNDMFWRVGTGEGELFYTKRETQPQKLK